MEFIFFLLKFIYFGLIVLFFVYLPGFYALRYFKYDFSDWRIRFPTAVSLGLSLFLLSTYFLSWIHLEALYIILILVVVVYSMRNSLGLANLPKIKLYLPEIFLIFLGTLAMLYLTAFSGLLIKGQMIFYGSNIRDGIYHMALIGSLVHSFPPVHPELADVPLKGYHFFYDFFVADLQKFFNLGISDLVFRYVPVFLGVLYGLSFLALSTKLKFTRYSSFMFIFLAYFAGGIDFFLQPIVSRDFYNTGMNPLIVNIVNPSVLMSISILFSFYILLFNKNRKVLLPVILLGVLPQVKIYTAIVAFGSLAVISFISVFKKDFYFLKILIASSVIGAIVYLPTNFGAGGLILAPLLLYRHFMENYSLDFGLKFQVFEAHKNILRQVILYVEGLLLFFIPTLGIRLVSLFGIKKIFNKDFYTSENIFWIATILVCIFFASLFIQTEDVFNIVQFLWIAYIVFLIPAVVMLSKIAVNLKLKIFIGFFVVLISVPSFIGVVNVYSKEPYYISGDKMFVANFIKDNVPLGDGVIVVNNDIKSQFYNLPEISAVSSHQIFYEPTITSFGTSKNINTQRREIVGEINNKLTDCTGSISQYLWDIMRKYNIKYIMTLKNYTCMNNLPDFSIAKKSGEVTLFKLIK